MPWNKDLEVKTNKLAFGKDACEVLKDPREPGNCNGV